MTYPIPAEALKESVAFVGRTGSGKSHAAKGGVETLLRAGGRVCIVDPTSVWWGLRSSADGSAPGFPVAVFGGDHADVPIGETSGAALAATIAGTNLPAIIDVAEFTAGARTRFVTAFLEELYRANRSPLTLVIDEADMFAPQRAMPDQTVMLSRMEQIARRGRVRGFRTWLLTQRPATLHKDVLSQANTLVALQLTAPQDRDAIGAWIEGQADREAGKRLLADLPKLKKGEAWVWSPSHDLLERVRFPKLDTFDSGRTPEEGETPAPVTLAAVNLAAISESLRAAEAEEAENDPKVLHARIAALEKAKGAWSREDLDDAHERGRVEGITLARAAANDLNRIAREADRLCTLLSIAINEKGSAAGDFVAETAATASAAEEAQKRATVSVTVSGDGLRTAKASMVQAFERAVANAIHPLPKAERAILTAIAQRDPRPTSRAQASMISGYSIKSSSFANACGALRSSGLIDGRGDDMRVTAAGKKAVGKVPPLPTGAELVAYWRNKLPKAESLILQAIVDRYPRAATKDDIAARSGYSVTSSSFANALGKLRTLQLVHGRGDVTASEDLFT